MKTPNIELAIETYYTKIELNTAEICALYSCGRSTALKLKDIARDEMAKQGKRNFVSHCVSTKIAYTAWGLDIADLEERYKKLRRIMGDKRTEVTL